MPLINQLSAARPARILIVEDEYFVALNAQQILEEAGFIVTGIATSAIESLEKAATDTPEIILMDIRIQGPRDGIDAAIELHSKLNLRCIFVTAHAEAATKQRAEPARPIGWLQKPYSEVVLIQMINNALESSS